MRTSTVELRTYTTISPEELSRHGGRVPIEAGFITLRKPDLGEELRSGANPDLALVRPELEVMDEGVNISMGEPFGFRAYNMGAKKSDTEFKVPGTVRTQLLHDAFLFPKDEAKRFWRKQVSGLWLARVVTEHSLDGMDKRFIALGFQLYIQKADSTMINHELEARMQARNQEFADVQ